jgi:ribosomal protein S18 acetylase RimI-like enzyme
MQSLAISYVKRYKMEIGLAGLPPPAWPDGFVPAAWRPDLLDAHAQTLCGCFQGGIDASVFPSLGNLDGCRGLIAEIAHRRAFIPEATWLAVGPDGPCGTVQALRERGVVGAIQNVGIVPGWRGRGVGRALLLQALRGMWLSGLGRAVLEVTANNDAAVRLYRRLGFLRSKVVYKAIPASPAAPPLGGEHSVIYV